MTVPDLEKIHSDSFGLWVSGLFSAIEGNNRGMSFTDQKQAFFEILTLWLDEGKIKFCRPDEPLGQVWDASSREIVDYLRALWPPEAQDENDVNLNIYFYEIPAVKWVDVDGDLHGSWVSQLLPTIRGASRCVP